MKLLDLFIAVREKSLDKDQLEDYRNQMSDIFAQMMLEVAELEKEEAMFMAKDFGERLSVADRKIQWKSTDKGQRLILLKRYCTATKELLNSLKSRLYSIY